MPQTAIVHNNATDTRAIARQAGLVLDGGGLVVFPTETVYGIAASVASDKGYAQLRRFKDRNEDVPFTIHLPDPLAADRYVDTTSPKLSKVIRKMFPGPVTLIIEVTDEVIQSKLKSLNLPAEISKRLYFKNTVGLRCPDQPLAQQILAATAAPVVASSANRRGTPPPHDANEAADAVGDNAALLIDGGQCKYTKPSTIVRLTGGSNGELKATVERDGVYDERFVHKLMRWTMLVVCSGNTCRSPMTEMIAKQILAEQRGLAIDELEMTGLNVLSAGAFTAGGSPASPEAIEAMDKNGIDLSAHRSQPLSPQLIHEADVIYCMTKDHYHAIVSMSPLAADKTSMLDPQGDIEDPFGSNATSYQRCAELIRRRLVQRLKEQQP